MRFEFGDGFELDRERRELTQRGGRVSVEPQVFDLLLCLLIERDRVVSRDDLLETVWKGRIVSESTLASRINAARRAIGDDGRSQALIRTVARRGLRFVGSVVTDDGTPSRRAPVARSPPPAQQISFLRAADGVTLAVGTSGRGERTLIKTANWLTHLEHDWSSPFWAPLLNMLSNGRRLVRYDARASGLSDRGVADISFEAFLDDLETVVAGVRERRFSLFGISQGAAVAAAYAAAHPERVDKLVLFGGYSQGRARRGSPEEAEIARAFVALLRRGWGDERSAFMRAYGSLYFPSASADQLAGWAELQRVSASAGDAIRIRTACDAIDVLETLPRIVAPTLVLHCRGDNVVPIEQGRRLAAGIPGARLVVLESDNHVVLPDEEAWPILLGEVDRFLAS